MSADDLEGPLYRRKPQVSADADPRANPAEWESILQIFQGLSLDEVTDFVRTLAASDNPELVTESFKILSQFHNEE